MGKLDKIMKADVAKQRYEAGEIDLFGSALMEKAREIARARNAARAGFEEAAMAAKNGNYRTAKEKADWAALYMGYAQTMEKDWDDMAESCGDVTAKAVGPIGYLMLIVNFG